MGIICILLLCATFEPSHDRHSCLSRNNHPLLPDMENYQVTVVDNQTEEDSTLKSLENSDQATDEDSNLKSLENTDQATDEKEPLKGSTFKILGWTFVSSLFALKGNIFKDSLYC
ncbi:hypothetical protein L1987_37687 [Smallanthus sonchifolius]|uniref:Uncharacterized protein n=1 Tax=Smallanthus sonchifolius TaxID=185202 RepID=A0ACB9HHZ1_9ASTR|nr:hypothetical protein L1987_37687 [Smallanthus sonchifolius]